jgi:hypothetical protein
MPLNVVAAEEAMNARRTVVCPDGVLGTIHHLDVWSGVVCHATVERYDGTTHAYSTLDISLADNTPKEQ